MLKPQFRVKQYAHKKYRFVVRGKVNGKWKRRYFETEVDAVTFADQQNARTRNALTNPGPREISSEATEGVPYGTNAELAGIASRLPASEQHREAQSASSEVSSTSSDDFGQELRTALDAARMELSRVAFEGKVKDAQTKTLESALRDSQRELQEKAGRLTPSSPTLAEETHLPDLPADAELEAEKISVLEGHIAALDDYIERSRTKFAILHEDLQMARRGNEDYRAQIEQRSGEIATLESNRADLREVIEEGREKFAELWAKFRHTESQNESTIAELQQALEQQQTAGAEIDRLHRLAEELRGLLATERLQAEQQLTAFERQKADSDRQLSEAESTLEASFREVARRDAALALYRVRVVGGKIHRAAIESQIANVSRALAKAVSAAFASAGRGPSLVEVLSRDIERIGSCTFWWKASRSFGLLKLAGTPVPQTPSERRTITAELRHELCVIRKAMRSRNASTEKLAAAFADLIELSRRTGEALLLVDLREIFRRGRVRTAPQVSPKVFVEDIEPGACGSLFDPDWYLGNYADVAEAGAVPLEHYRRCGCVEGRDPNPLFATSWYLAENPDVAAANLEPLTHYALHGADEGRNPHPLFDGCWYLARYPDVAAAHLNPFRHYLEWGAPEGRNPHPLFDAAWYQIQNPEIDGLNPLEHYLASGWRLGRDPHPLFHVAWYLARNPDVASSGMEPLQHYLAHGGREGREPNPSFETRFYLEQLGGDEASAVDNPLLHYVENGRQRGLVPERPSTEAPAHISEPELSPIEFTLHAPRFEIQREPMLPGEHARPDVQAIAFFLPQFHRIPQNDAWWGEGFTEWTNVRRGRPNFSSHYQPHIPSELGYYDLSDPVVLERQARLARAAGIHGFCLYFYWFAGEVLLDFPLRTIVESTTDFPFCICWANENWTRRWDGREDEILIGQSHSPEDDVAFIEYVEPALTAKSYIRVDGKPMLLVYRPSLLPDAAATLRRWRERFRDRGHGELHLVMVRSFTEHVSPEVYGFDAAVQFPPHYHATPVTALVPEREENFSGVIYDYMEVRRKALEEFRGASGGRTLYPGVMPSWDNTARRGADASLWVNSSPEAYADWLREVASITRTRAEKGRRFVFINAWNEWAEGCHLEPDERFGFAWLNATALALCDTSSRDEIEATRAANPDPPVIEPVDLAPLAGRVKVAISVLLYHREDIVSAFLGSLLPQLAMVSGDADFTCELFLSFNYQPSAAVRAQIDAAVAEHVAASADCVRVIENGFNLGFGAGHNAVFASSECDLFLTLNSDLEIERDDWLGEVVQRFRMSGAALVGLEQNASVLRDDACGLSLPYHGADFDFVDASLLAIRADVARRFGLFSPAFDYFYFEDVDLCLRYRQIGLRIELLSLPSKHERSSSSRLLPHYAIESVLDRNRARFFDRWGKYLESRALPNRLAVRFTTIDRQVQCASLPGLFGLLEEHPAAVLDVWGVHEQIAPLFAHARVRLVSSWQELRGADYLRSYELGDDLPRDRPLLVEIAEQLGTDLALAAARHHLESLGAATVIVGRVLIYLPRMQPVFDGRQPDVASFSAVAEALRGQGFQVTKWSEYAQFEIEDKIGDAADLWKSVGATSGAEILPEVLRADTVITTDGWVSEVAQLTGRRTLLWLGAVSSVGAIWNNETTASFRDESLDCLGCYERYGRGDRNTCLRGDVACMRAGLQESFRDVAARFCSGAPVEAPRFAPTLAKRRNQSAASSQLNLKAWARSSAGSLLVLTPVHPRLPHEVIARAHALAERAISGMPGCRIVHDDQGEAPLRGVPHVQRQAAMANLRQGMVERHLRDEQWVFWVDADVVEYSPSLLDELIARADGGIAAPFVLMEGETDETSRADGFGPGRFYDIGGFVEDGRWARFTAPYFDQAGPVFRLDSVGSCYVVNADLYRHGAKHEIDPASKALLEAEVEWPSDAIERNQAGPANSFTEHYSVCAAARSAGLPVRAFADLVARHQKG